MKDWENIKDHFVMGRHPVEEALKSDQRIEKIWIDKVIRGPFEREIRYACREKGIQLQVVPKEKLDYLVRRKAHQGIIALLSHVAYYNLDDVVQWYYEQGNVPKILVLENVEDIRNVGAIARSALWFGFETLVLPKKGAARINAAAIKSSAGALLTLKICKEESIANTIDSLKSQGLICLAADMDGQSLESLSLEKGQGVCLVMGSEGKGISRSVSEKVDNIVSIPGSGKMESLNVSVAAGILMHSLFKFMS